MLISVVYFLNNAMLVKMGLPYTNFFISIFINCCLMFGVKKKEKNICVKNNVKKAKNWCKKLV